MTQSDWIELLELIPSDQHNQLIVMSRTGIELSIDLLLRTEPAYFVFRGRVCGNTDEGRVFFFPYNEITCVYLNRVVKEKEISDIFDDAANASDTSMSSAGLQHHGSFDSHHLPITPQSANTSSTSDSAIPGTGSGYVPRPGSGALPAIKLPPSISATAVQPGSANPRGSNPIIPPLIPPVPTTSSETPTPKGSILERLRAQRSNVNKR